MTLPFLCPNLAQGTFRSTSALIEAAAPIEFLRHQPEVGSSWHLPEIRFFWHLPEVRSSWQRPDWQCSNLLGTSTGSTPIQLGCRYDSDPRSFPPPTSSDRRRRRFCEISAFSKHQPRPLKFFLLRFRIFVGAVVFRSIDFFSQHQLQPNNFLLNLGQNFR